MNRRTHHRQSGLNHRNSGVARVSADSFETIRESLMDALRTELDARQAPVKAVKKKIFSKDFFVLAIEVLGIVVSLIF